ncbi:hypothetical protein FGG08_000290 [Glutinoglossum americanum]|uniref:HAD-superfamily phosphatase n=1 Tax=Glutinoglossum americanum TaxID=1670608 RepID=A0A9P8I473_9PEZI|nr:hypothetical protein FGG08_000290 [Glutinoglossum americanum]
MNLSASLNIFRLIRDPALCLPHSSISTFNHLPVPLSKGFGNQDGPKNIRAVVLDKDNCFAVPHKNTIHEPYSDKFQQLREAYPGNRLLVVSNSAGTGDDPDGKEADLLEKNTGVKVLRHSTKKPGCRAEIFNHFVNSKDTGVTSPEQIAIVGDRLFTDVMMANLMGSWSVWVKHGVVEEKSFFMRLETRFFNFLIRRGYSAPKPRSILK